MITFEQVTKAFSEGTTAVADLDLHVPEGELVVLVGPSGCGKTTTLRIVNRMIEPTSGRLIVDGKDALAQAPHELRRRIGYVIQQVGLFPHRTTADNIATVPKLLGWNKTRTHQRVTDLMETVGLPDGAANRYPYQLSGGQRQRVGVARALAVDPTIMLMDEPFGAVDPIVRQHLQDEFVRLQRDLRKTILFVTHDINEAIRMGDRIAILNVGGVLEQYDTPEELLRSPANDFVADFLGEDRELKRLALIRVGDVEAERGPVVAPEASIEEVINVAAEVGTSWVMVVDEHGVLRGWAKVDDIELASGLANVQLRQPKPTVSANDSLRTAVNAMLASNTGVAVRLSEGNHYEGIITEALASQELR